MASTTHYDTFSEARNHLKDLLDAAQAGRPATVRREATVAAVVDAERLRSELGRLPSIRPAAVAEAGGWSVFIPGAPIAGDGKTFDAAVEDFVSALREYAEDWDRLRDARNHRGTWVLVQFAALSSDDSLREWVTGARTE